MKSFYFSILFVIITLSLSASELDQIVHIYGEQLTSKQVLEQVDSKTDLIIDNRLNDSYGFKKNYDNHVSVSKIFDALKEYFKEFNKLDIKIRTRGHAKYILEGPSSTTKIKRLIIKDVEKKDLLVEDTRKAQRPKEDIIEVTSGKKETHAATSSSLFDNLLDVDIVQGKKSSVATVKPSKNNFEIDDYSFNKKFENENQSIKVKKENVKSDSLQKRLGIVALPGIDVQDYGLSFSGLLAGYLSPKTLPKHTLKNNSWYLNVGTEIQSGEGSESLAGVNQGYDSELYVFNVTGSKRLVDNLDIVSTLSIAGHNGDYVVLGVANSDLNPDIKEFSLGAVYEYPLTLGKTTLPLMASVTSKLPIGKASSLVSTEKTDLSLQIGSYYEFDHVLAKLQLGYNMWGGHKGLVNVSSHKGINVIGEVQYTLNNEYQLIGRINFLENPLANSASLGMFSDEVVSFQTGLSFEIYQQKFKVLANIGMSESASDFGLAFFWETLLK